LLIADRALGMVPMSADGGQPAAAVVHRSGLLDALLALFDAAWAGRRRCGWVGRRRRGRPGRRCRRWTDRCSGCCWPA
jgi:hypothetical protein